MTLHTKLYHSDYAVSVEELASWHAQPGAFQRLTPPWARVEVIDGVGTIQPGNWKTLRIRPFGPASIDWTLVHEPLDVGIGFRDRQIAGPFQQWLHDHRFIPRSASSSRLEDTLVYQLPLGALGNRILRERISRNLDSLFAFRHQRTRQDLLDHRRGQLMTPKRIAITGSSGLVGQRLVPYLKGGGHDVVRLVRHRTTDPGEIYWDPSIGEIDRQALEGVDAVINLAGVSIAGKRWSAARKQAILQSRVQGTRLLAESIAQLSRRPDVLISTSAVGYYGDRGSAILTEKSPRGAGFLSDVCMAWESAADPARAAGIRVVHPRFGIVMAGEGGMLPLIARIFKFGLGGRIGRGEQFMSWIDADDLIRVLRYLMLDDRFDGPINAVAPEPVENREFTQILSRVLNRPAVLPAPEFGVRLITGQMGEELILTSQRAIPSALDAHGFEFLYPALERAVRQELGRPEPDGPKSLPSTSTPEQATAPLMAESYALAGATTDVAKAGDS